MKRASVPISVAMHLPADFAVRWWLRVVHVMPDRFERLEVGKYGGDILASYLAVGVPQHDLAELPPVDVPGEDRLHKYGLVDPRRIGSDVGTGHAAPRPVENEPTAEVHAWQRLPMRVLRRVAVRTCGDGHQIFPAFFGSREVGVRHRRVKGLRHAADQ